ncbi:MULTISPECIES: hypothetical protein [Corallococcus]|uniref:hypothetical protein n=1 Tax=Corallococcus TaxID=83461 RepID=UPI0011801854|nr:MULTISPECIES: hypothetical protein [Corallococcus]NBD14232.1 hypothetical protein [Corallococcus silvisoli]TSC29327.1 hypothetical protein FOF48_15455 [Corallococcus sp. Z5C101001]
MSERPRSSTVLPRAAGSDAERQLEGRAEVLEAARRSHSELEQVLSHWRWRRRLLRRPELVPELLAQEEALTEALERVRRRAALESWAEDTPVLREARKLLARRERLTRLARRRLGAWGRAHPEVSLEEALTRLEDQVRRPESWALKPGEVLVFEDDTWRRPGPGLATVPTTWELPPRLVMGLGILSALCFLLLLLVPARAEPAVAAFFVLTALAPMSTRLLRSGRLRLTSERLLWDPLFGALQGVRLGSIPDGGVRLESSEELFVEGDRVLRARSVKGATAVAVLVELHRQPPLRGAARSGVRLERMALFPAKLGRRRGFCVLGPQGLSFIPEGKGPQALRALTGEPTSLRKFDSDLVLDALRWLPEAEFDDCVMRVVEATGGAAWTRVDSRHLPGASARGRIRIEHAGMTLTGRVPWDRQETVERLLRDWPR